MSDPWFTHCYYCDCSICPELGIRSDYRIFDGNYACNTCATARERRRAEQRQQERAEAQRKAAQIQREKEEAQKQREREELIQANQEFSEFEKNTQKLNNFIDNYKLTQIEDMIQSSLSNSKWVGINYELRLVHQHKKYHDKRIYVWKYCKIFCMAKNHVIFDHNENNWPSRKGAASFRFGQSNAEIKDILNVELQFKDCPGCKNEIETAKAMVNKFEVEQDKILDVLKKSNAENIKLSHITKLESDLNQLFKRCKEQIESVNDIAKYAKSVTEEEEKRPTYETKLDLDTFIQKAASHHDKILQEKQKIFIMDKQISGKEIEIINKQKDIGQDIVNEKLNKMKLNECNENLDTLKKELRLMMEDKCMSDIVSHDKMQQLHRLIDQLFKKLHGKYIQYEERMNELNNCKKRIDTIRSKLDHQKGKNKHLLKLLADEYDRLSAATQSAMKKFEQNGIYFLSVTVGLKEDIIDKFIDFGCDKLDDIKDMNDADLQEIGIESNLMRKKILKYIIC